MLFGCIFVVEIEFLFPTNCDFITKPIKIGYVLMLPRANYTWATHNRELLQSKVFHVNRYEIAITPVFLSKYLESQNR